VLERILSENDRVASANRDAFGRAGVRAVNLMSAPGAGKTALLRRTLEALGDVRVGVLEGDIETSLDAEALEGFGAAVSLVNTSAGFGGECHLDAVMVRSGLGRLPLAELDLLVVENVGNLVCPAEFDVGEHARAMVCSVTEGEDKPLKYPVMYRAADVVVVNKVDLLPHLDLDRAVPGQHRRREPWRHRARAQRPHRRGRRRLGGLAPVAPAADGVTPAGRRVA
jgi:hydrogenase nickel incorporation protein HypB